MPEEPRAPYDPMPHGPAEVGVGPWVGALPDRGGVRRRPAGRRGPAQRGRPLPLLDARGDRRRPRHPAARLPRGHRELAARLQHRHDRAHAPTRSSPREVHIVGKRRWNRRGAMVTDRYQHVRHHATPADLAAHLHERGVQLMGVDNLPGSEHLETWEMPRSVCLLFGQEGPGLSDAGPGGLRRDLLDRAVRLDPLDQRLGGRGDRHAHLDRPGTPTSVRPGGWLVRTGQRACRRARWCGEGSGGTGQAPDEPVAGAPGGPAGGLPEAAVLAGQLLAAGARAGRCTSWCRGRRRRPPGRPPSTR